MDEQSLFWADQKAREIVEREKKLGRRLKLYRSEMGMGASGVPHVGSAGDGVRAFAVHLALQDLGLKSEFIAFADDVDGLRKVPYGFPDSLEKDIGKPVSRIKDPFGCHDSFGAHMSSLLIDAFEKLGVSFILKRGSEEYRKGTLDKEIIEILTKADEAGKIVKEVTGSEKFIGQLPYLPICAKCGNVYTTRAYKFIPKENKILYKCDLDFEGKNSTTDKPVPIKGCGHEGECGIRDGKLAWKVEFAARWRALQITHETYGKDILDSVKCNDVVSERILKWAPPVHSFYEMFTERGGKKISKSAGNVFTPQTWMNYGSPESLRLLFLKRLATTRVVDMDTIPIYMDEVDRIAKVYFSVNKLQNERGEAHLRRLYEYISFLKTPNLEYKVMIPYNTLVNLLKTTKDKKATKDMLVNTGHIPEKLSKDDEKELERRLVYAERWIADTEEEKPKIKLSQKQKASLKIFAEGLAKTKTEEDIKNLCFSAAKEAGVRPQDFFYAAYFAILGEERGPKLAPLILSMGKEKVIKLIKSFSV